MKRAIAVACALLLAGCAAGPVIDRTYVARSQGSRVLFLVLHYTVEDFPGSLKILTEQSVSSHYLVNDDPPAVYQLVDESRMAYHAGVSSWRGYSMLNSNSIGIEIVNRASGDEPEGATFPEYPGKQMDVVVWLVKDIVARHGIRPENIVAHGEIAPQRKMDPGPKFPWKRLADEGLIKWPDAAEVARRLPVFEGAPPDAEWYQRKLARHGYAVPSNGTFDERTLRVIAAFQMRYRQAKYDGMPDAETAAILDVLVSP